MTIKIRQKDIGNGNKSLYLDIYEKGKRRYEYLNLYLIPEIDDRAKAANEVTMENARQIRSERILHPESIQEAKRQEIKDNKTKDSSISLLEWLDTYIAITSENPAYSKAIVEQSQYLKTCLEEFLKARRRQNIRLNKFDKESFKAFFLWLKNDYTPKKYKRMATRPLSDGTLRNLQQRIVAVFNKAVRNGLLKANPFYTLERNDTFAKPEPKLAMYLTLDEVKRFMASKETSPGVVESQKSFGFACLTGLRISDIRALRWSDIMTDADTDTIIIVQKKTKAVNAVPICSTAKSWMPEKGDDDKVFHLPSSSCVYDNVRRIARNAGIDKDISFHTSRHTFGTLIQSVVGNIELTKELMGHKNVKTTVIYADVVTEEKVKAVDNANGRFGKHSAKKENRKIPRTKRTAATNRHPRKVIKPTENSAISNTLIISH